MCPVPCLYFANSFFICEIVTWDPLSILTLISLYLAANGWVDRIKDSTARAVNPPQASQIRESKGSVRESPVLCYVMADLFSLLENRKDAVSPSQTEDRGEGGA